MDTEDVPLKEIMIGVFLAVFFVAGFGTAKMTGQEKTSPTKNTDTTISSEEAVSNGETYLRNGPLSYPFTYNLSTQEINRIEIGNTEMYNWTVSYTVESNPFQGPTYEVTGNQTQAIKTMNLYLTTDGKYVFPSQPIQITQ